MKKIFYIITALFIFQITACASYNDVLVADISYDWINKSEVERETMIEEVKDIIFENPVTKDKSLKKACKDKLKDKDRIEHYMAASAGYKEYNGYNISAFYYKNKKYIYMYALQDKKDLTKKYYYDALGHLKYVDYIYGEYPEYPYYAIQYKISGKPVSAIYYASRDSQYMYNPDESFVGLWYKYNLYDKHSKIILRRTSY